MNEYYLNIKRKLKFGMNFVQLSNCLFLRLLPPTPGPAPTECLMTQISNCTSTSSFPHTAISSSVLPPSTAPYYECLIVQLSNCRLLLTTILFANAFFAIAFRLLRQRFLRTSILPLLYLHFSTLLLTLPQALRSAQRETHNPFELVAIIGSH